MVLVLFSLACLEGVATSKVGDLMSQQQIIKQCRSAIKSLLWEHAEFPLRNMREEDFRSSLLQKLRDLIGGSVSVLLKQHKNDSFLPIDDARREKAVTNRVHAEIQLHGKLTGRKKKSTRLTYDLVILKKKPVVFRVKQSGADVLEHLEMDDVAVVIEIKAAPSNKQHEKFKDDIKKLRSRKLGDARRFLVVIDKSMPLGMPIIGNREPEVSWWESLKKRGEWANDVEVWFLNEDEEPASRFAIQH